VFDEEKRPVDAPRSSVDAVVMVEPDDADRQKKLIT